MSDTPLIDRLCVITNQQYRRKTYFPEHVFMATEAQLQALVAEQVALAVAEYKAEAERLSHCETIADFPQEYHNLGWTLGLGEYFPTCRAAIDADLAKYRKQAQKGSAE